MDSIADISIIGTGAVGSTLARALLKAGYQLRGLYNRTEEHAATLARELRVAHSAAFPRDVSELGSVVFITVVDGQVEAVAQKLASLEGDWTGRTAVHCSGTLSTDALQPLKRSGASVLSMHPLQTFQRDSLPEAFRDIYFSLQGDGAAASRLSVLAEDLGAGTFPIDKSGKAYLHAAAVMACNYLVSLLDAAGATAEAGGMDKEQAVKVMMPLVRQTLQNVESTGTVSSLSGPVARGDAGTVKRHLELLGEENELREIYRLMGRYTLKLARKRGLGDSVTQELEKLFGG